MAHIQFSHANGIPAPTYQYLFDQLQPHEVSYLPVFGLGDYQPHNDWMPLVDELIATMEGTHQEPVIGIGHSLGGVLTCWAALKRPELFQRIILLDPPFLGPEIRRWLIATHWLGPKFRERIVPLAQKANRRRDHFTSHEEAREYWGKRRFFQRWHPTCFEAYVEHSLVEGDGGGLSLRIPRDLEAHIFATTPHRLRGGRLQVPAHYLYAADEGIVPAEVLEGSHRRAFPGMAFIPVAGGHMFPVEQPDQTAELIKRLVGNG